MIQLSETLIEQIRRHATETYPHECCGALIGCVRDHVKDITDVLPMKNRQTDVKAHSRFLVTAEDHRELEILATKRGLEILGFYHSHPDHPARPSEYDREHALPWYSYAIVSVCDGESADLECWNLTEDRATFSSEPISVAR
jgi:proteasome lid subunit RPN8/RPN11